jgi:hypothetical protein
LKAGAGGFLRLIAGAPLRVTFRAELTAWRGELRSRDPRGTPVHAASHIRRREIVLDADLLRHPEDLARIFVHEVHHFVWVRLGNRRRRAYEEVLRREFEARARGELGWSAENLKRRLGAADIERRSRKWREYVCESFCDTAAWRYAGLRSHPEWTLAERFRRKRAAVLEGMSDSPRGL